MLDEAQLRRIGAALRDLFGPTGLDLGDEVTAKAAPPLKLTLSPAVDLTKKILFGTIPVKATLTQIVVSEAAVRLVIDGAEDRVIELGP